ncbi:DUF4123 domain-containing protein [Celerinatantimonas sp. YJH-8]|uniref:DUF4123 domain-containing protein n=1 Tax=Celerinatantimonas sp. YJH-8 TaxID=3228714 RepID=UPI0038C010B5
MVQPDPPVSVTTGDPASLFEVMSQTTDSLYILVDRILIPEFDEFWHSFSSRPDWLWQHLYRGRSLGNFKAGSPLVVPVSQGSPGETLYYWLLEQLDYRQRFGLVICSSLSLTELTEHLRHWALILFPDGEQALFRFFDPSVLRQAWPVFTPMQQTQFMQPISSIYLPDSGIAEQPLIRLTAAQFDESLSDECAVLQLTQGQYDRLFYDERLEGIIRVLTQKLRESRHCHIPLEQVRVQFMAGLEQGQIRYPNQPSLAYETYALYRFYLAGDFDQHPEFQRLLKFNELRAAIGRFYHQFGHQSRALADYHPIQFEPPQNEEL